MVSSSREEAVLPRRKQIERSLSPAILQNDMMVEIKNAKGKNSRLTYVNYDSALRI